MLNRFERFSFAISEISRCWHKLAAEELAKYALNSPHAVYLNTLYQHAEGITAAKLGELCGKDKADVSRMVSILEKKELLQREAVGDNMYRALLKLTDKGQEAARHVQQRAALAVELAGAGLSEQERSTFYHALGLITANLQTLSKEGLPEKGREVL
jgi:DNA-binding MarR family transcriptional regulator